MTTYYVDPANGSDANSGTEANPFESLAGFDEVGTNSDVLTSGDVVILKDTAIDSFSDSVTMTGVNGVEFKPDTGNSGNYIVDGSSLSAGSTLWRQFDCNNVDWIGTDTSNIVFRHAPSHAFRIQSSSGNTSGGGEHRYIRIEDYGENTSFGGNGLWLSSGANNTTWYDCTFYNGHQPGDSDGIFIGAQTNTRPGGHRFERCEASYNTDDGIDLFYADSNNGSVFVECTAHHNGKDQETWDGNASNFGDGNGFKSGGDSGGAVYYYRCFAYSNSGITQSGEGSPTGDGFTDNTSSGNWHLQCTAYNNEDWGFDGDDSSTRVINSVAYQNGSGPVNGSLTDENNSFNLGSVSLSDADFQSTTEGNSGFLVPDADSEIVDLGVILDGYTTNDGTTIDLTNDPPSAITETFDGSAPDLGYIETTGTASPSFAKSLNGGRVQAGAGRFLPSGGRL